MTAKTSSRRRAILEGLASTPLDLLVVGGGIAGACTAWDAALRGLAVGLVEQADFSSGASAHSLKILHGGIRYLQHMDFKRLRESCRERAAFLQMAPHLTRPLPFVVPTYGYGLRGKLPLRVAFTVLNALTRDRNRDLPEKRQQIPDPSFLSRREVLERFPVVASDGLTGAGVFHDGQIVNPPRLVYSMVRSAQELGALAANHVSFERVVVRGGRVAAAQVRDHLGGNVFDIRARVIANVAGPFAAAVAAQATGGPVPRVALGRDMAFVIRRRIGADMALALQTRFRDPDAWLARGNRHLFMVPWRDSATLIGVNSKLYDGDPAQLTVTDAEIDIFLEEINSACPALKLSRADIGVVNAGLLPFGENAPSTDHLSFGRRSILLDHAERGGPDGLLTAISVNWTMGRSLGENVVDAVGRKLGRALPASRTATTQVWGAYRGSREALIEAIRKQAHDAGMNIPEQSLSHLADTYGGVWPAVLAAPGGARLLPDGRTLAGEVSLSVRDEMAVTLSDVLLRRLDVGTAGLPDEPTLLACAEIAATQAGWDTVRTQEEIARLRASYPFASPVSQQFVKAS